MSLTLQEQELLTRLLEAGTVRSTDLLGKMSNTEWGVMSSSIREMSVVRVLSWFSKASGKYLSVQLRSDGKLPLEFALFFSEKSARAVTDAVTKPFSEQMKKIPDLVRMTIGEVSNVMAQSVLGLFADEYRVSIILSVPKVFEGKKVDLLAAALESYDGREDVFLMANVDMFSESLAAECGMIVTANSAALRNILASKQIE